jgi:hypothetical protein
MNAHELDYDAFHQEIETLRRKYRVAIAYYYVHDLELYLQDVHNMEVSESEVVADWIWQNTPIAKNIHNELNNCELVESFFDDGYDAYLHRDRKAQ